MVNNYWKFFYNVFVYVNKNGQCNSKVAGSWGFLKQILEFQKIF